MVNSNNDLTRFGFAVAASAKSYQVRQIVSGFVMVIFSENVAKITHWDSMVDIVIFPKKWLSLAAILTSIFIALKGFFTLFFPVGAIVNIATFPEWMILASNVNALPIGITLFAAKLPLASLYPARDGLEPLATVITALGYGLALVVFGASVRAEFTITPPNLTSKNLERFTAILTKAIKFPLGFSSAIHRTEFGYPTLNLISPCLKSCLAILTNSINLRISRGINTGLRAERASVVLKSRGSHLKRLAAILADSFDHSRHKSYLVI